MSAARGEIAAIVLFPLMTFGGGAIGVVAVLLMGLVYGALHAKLDPAGASDGAADIGLTILLTPIGFLVGLTLAVYLTVRFLMPTTSSDSKSSSP